MCGGYIIGEAGAENGTMQGAVNLTVLSFGMWCVAAYVGIGLAANWLAEHRRSGLHQQITIFKAHSVEKISLINRRMLERILRMTL